MFWEAGFEVERSLVEILLPTATWIFFFFNPSEPVIKYVKALLYANSHDYFGTESKEFVSK